MCLEAIKEDMIGFRNTGYDRILTTETRSETNEE